MACTFCYMIIYAYVKFYNAAKCKNAKILDTTGDIYNVKQYK